MKRLREYKEYTQYLEHQSSKTLDPERRRKWLNEEWELKLSGFTDIFTRLDPVVQAGHRALCIGARTGQEVAALRSLGVDAIGIDIVPHEDLVIEGDMHELPFEDNSFDFVFSNVFGCSLHPDKKVAEIERVLKVDGHALIQLQLGVTPDKFSENEIDNVDHDVICLFEQSKIVHSHAISSNFAGMNWEILMGKDSTLSSLYGAVGKISTLEMPSEYQQIWNDINLPIQQKKANNHNLDQEYAEQCFSNLQRRSFYLTSIANFVGAKNIAEVGTAQGWQCYSFAHYASENDGHVWSCDIVDVRDETYAKKYDETVTFVHGNSRHMADQISNDGVKIDMFYIDGSHQAKAVLTDIKHLRHLQSDNCVWVFDDFDTRFGCFREIQMLRNVNNKYKIYRVGDAASGNPNHQVVIFGKL